MDWIYKDISLKPYNTFGIDVSALYFAMPENLDELKQTIEFAIDNELPINAMGGGSNIIFTHYYHGVIINPAFRGIELIDKDQDYVYVKVGAGEEWDNFVEYCINNGWGGIENLSAIPGQVGASPVQNIGAYGVEVKDCIYRVETLSISTLSVCSFSNIACGFGYRDSIFKSGGKDEYIVTSVIFKLSLHPQFVLTYGNLKEVVSNYGEPSLSNIRSAVIEIRKNKLPDIAQYGSVGSFFKNPIVSISTAERLKQSYPQLPCYPTSHNKVKLSAGYMIEYVGWKGKSFNDKVGVYSKQALILFNLGEATGKDVMNCSTAIIEDVYMEFGILLYPEAIIM